MFCITFLADGQLRSIETNEPFKFEVKKGDRAYNQKNYEALGEVRTNLYFSWSLELLELPVGQ